MVVDADSATDQGLAEGPFVSLSAAPSGKFLAGLTAGGRLIVWLSDFSKARAPCKLHLIANKCETMYKSIILPLDKGGIPGSPSHIVLDLSC